MSYSAHIAGAVTGLLLGTVLLRNLSASTWERATWWCSLLLFLGKNKYFPSLLKNIFEMSIKYFPGLFLGAIVWNAIEIFVNGDISIL